MVTIACPKSALFPTLDAANAMLFPDPRLLAVLLVVASGAMALLDTRFTGKKGGAGQGAAPAITSNAQWDLAFLLPARRELVVTTLAGH